MKTEDIDQIIAEALEQKKGDKRQWHRPSHKKERVKQARSVLNLLHILGFVAAVTIYFVWPEQRLLFFSVGFGAIILKIAEFVLRFMF